jgi:hypothetical protein
VRGNHGERVANVQRGRERVNFPNGTYKDIEDSIKRQREIERQAEQMRQALEDMTYHYIDLVESGDCGNWEPLDEEIVKRCKALVAHQRGGEEDGHDE